MDVLGLVLGMEFPPHRPPDGRHEFLGHDEMGDEVFGYHSSGQCAPSALIWFPGGEGMVHPDVVPGVEEASG